MAFAAKHGHPDTVRVLLDAWGQPELDVDDLVLFAKLAACGLNDDRHGRSALHGRVVRDQEAADTLQRRKQQASTVALLAKERHTQYPANVYEIFEDWGPRPVPETSTIAALLDGWLADTSDLDAQRAAVRGHEQEVAEKRAVQQLLLAMACQR
jgi:hypothetical protein